MKKKIFIYTMFSAVIFLTSACFADEISDIKDKLQAKQEECTLTENEIKQLESEKKTLRSNAVKYDSELKAIYSEIQIIEKNITIAESELQEAERAEHMNKNIFYERLRVMYEHGKMQSVEMVLDSEDIMTLERKLDYIEQISEYDREVFDKAAQLRAKKRERKNELDKINLEYNNKSKLLDEKLKENNENIKSVNSKIKEKKEMLVMLVNEKNIINTELNRLTFEGRLFAEAEKYIGYPYVFGGSTPETSFDCSGFVCWAFTKSGVYNLPRTNAQGIYDQCMWISKDDARPGDLIFFEGTYDAGVQVTHVGIYAGDDKMLHCGSPIQYTSINTDYWIKHFYSFGRLGRI